MKGNHIRHYWMAIKIGTNRHGPQRMNLSDYGTWLTFLSVTSWLTRVVYQHQHEVKSSSELWTRNWQNYYHQLQLYFDILNWDDEHDKR